MQNLLFLLFFFFHTHAVAAIVDDSIKVLYINDLFKLIKSHHPAVKSADLNYQEAAAILLKAKGNFDPKLKGSWERKSFNEKDYFSLGSTELKIPTTLGINFKGGYHLAAGQFVNPEHTLPEGGQAIAGIEWNPGRGLFIDPARLERQQAGLAADIASADRQLQVNAILETAADIYWNWVAAYLEAKVFERGVQTAIQRLEAVRESYIRGDKPAVDTLEALIILQNRKYDLSTAQMAYENAGFQLEAFLWENGQIPLNRIRSFLPPTSLPQFPFTPDKTQLIQNTTVSHPSLTLYRLDISNLELEEKWKQEQLKPELTIQYNLLGDGFNFSPPAETPSFTSLLTGNYKYGISVAYPILNRKERASLQLTRIKMSKKQLGLESKQQEIISKINYLYNQWLNNTEQFDMLSGVAEGYRKLLQAENEKFSLGKSSLFLVNSREQKYIDSQIKQREIQVKMYKTFYKLYAAAALLPDL